MRNICTKALGVLLTLAMAGPALAEEGLKLPELSPLARVMQTVGVAEVTVEYSSPGLRDREVFADDGLVPFGKLWRTGANAATKLTLSHDAKIGGKDVPAGTYAIFTIPGEDEWTFIVNENADQGGTRSYDEKLDQARLKVKPQEAPKRERLTFLFSDTTADSTRLDLVWEETRVSVPVEFPTAKYAKSNIGDYATGASRALVDAARYFADHDDMDAALEYVDASIAVKRTWFNTWIKASFLADTGDYAAAYPLAQKAWEMGEKAEVFFYRDQVKKALEEWKDKR
ncbi:MAG: DUF2911 domain-containing protein [Myxococcota bacterium]